tara:strand:+ start:713 stop:1786 length:1074 start_codon:yes stop_codon:yes gene_type:complete
MAYSGTVGTTVIDVQTLIDHGARRCGKLAEELTSEQQLSARESLYFLMSNLANRGIQYWAINKEVVGLTADKYIYELPLGSVDVLQALYRQMNRTTPNSGGGYTSSAGGIVANAFDSNIDTICTQTSTNGNISVNYGTSNPVYIGSIGYLPGATGTMSIIYEYSADGITWKTLVDLGSIAVVDNQWIWTDIVAGQTVQYYRVRAYNATTLVVREVYFGNNSTEIPMARLNRDDYTNLPNKNFTANQPFQFWFDRTVPKPSIYLWPVPSDTFVQMTLWYSRQVMDVGALTNELEIPQRWYEAVVSMLSHRMAMELPGVQVDRIGYLEKMADKFLFDAEQEERDKSPIYYAPNISVYTR